MSNLHYTRRDVLKLAAAGVAVPWLRPSATAGANLPAKPPGPHDDSDLLADRAVRFRERVLNAAMGPGGLLIAFMPADTLRPFQEGAPPPWFKMLHMPEGWGHATPAPTVPEFFYGENTLWATGWLLHSQILRYRATGEAEARQTAQKAFQDLNHVFRLSRSFEPGLLGKPHGGRPGPTTSYDQAANPVIFYAMYAQELATPEEKAEAVANMAEHGEYYLRHKWVMNHHGRLDDVEKANVTSLMKYLACEYAAYQMSGEKKFRDEALRLLRNLIKAGRLPFPTNPFESTHNFYYYSLLCDYWLKSEFADEFDWLGCIREYWHAQKTTLDANGFPQAGDYDTRSRTFLGTSKRDNPRDTWQPFMRLGARSPQLGAMAATLGVLAYSHGLDDEAPAVSRRILLGMDESALRWWSGPREKFPEEMRPLLDIFAPEVPAAWLMAYWMGRWQKVW